MGKVKVYRTIYTDNSVRYTVNRPSIRLAQDGQSVDATVPQPTADCHKVIIRGYVDQEGMVIRTPRPGVRLNWVGNDI